MAEFKKCPWCGETPELSEMPMWHGTHGYHGSFEVVVHCTNYKCPVKPKTPSYNTVYKRTLDEAKKAATNAWNDRKRGD